MRATEESRIVVSWRVAWPSFEMVEGSNRGSLLEVKKKRSVSSSGLLGDGPDF
jgi:hypothetical protein